MSIKKENNKKEKNSKKYSRVMPKESVYLPFKDMQDLTFLAKRRGTNKGGLSRTIIQIYLDAHRDELKN